MEIVDFQTGERCAASAIGSDYGKLKLEKSGLGPFVPGPQNDRLRAIGYVGREQAVPTPDRGHERGLEPRDDAPPLLAEYQAMRRARTVERQRALEQQRAHDRERREQLRSEQAAKRRRTRELVGGRTARAIISEIARYGAALRDQLKATISGERKKIQDEYGLVTWTDFVRDQAERGDARAIAEMTKLNGRETAVTAAPEPMPERELIAASVAPKPPFLERVAAQYAVRRVDAPQPGMRMTGEILDVDEDEGAVAIESGRNIASILRVPVERARELFKMIGSVVKARYDHAGKWDFELHDTQKQKEHENEIPR